VIQSEVRKYGDKSEDSKKGVRAHTDEKIPIEVKNNTSVSKISGTGKAYPRKTRKVIHLYIKMII